MTADFWDKIADRYARSPVRDPAAYEHTLERTATYLSPTDRVLEIGCGTGSTALRLAPAVADYTASDISRNMIGIGRRKAEAAGAATLGFAVADVHDPAFAPGSCDAVLAFNILHLVPDLPAALSRINALIEPGGMFISKTPCLSDMGVLKRAAIRVMIPVMQAIGKAPYVRYLGSEELKALIARHGFEIVETADHPETRAHRFIAARKV